MLRVVLVGVLAVTATSSCGDRGDTVKVAPGAAAGDVVEASGSVAATRGGASRKLAAGAEVFADDVIDAANGSVVIVLRHNRARWTVEGQGAPVRVDQSLAWKLAKQDGPTKVVDHAASAAGREGERAAADTRATSDRAAGDPEAAGAAEANKSAEPPPTPAPAARPAPAPAPEREQEDRADEPKGGKGGPPGGAPRGPTRRSFALESGAGAAAAPKPLDLEARRGELQRCLPGKTKLVLVVRVAGGVPAIELTGGGASAAVRACLERAVKQIPMAGLTATASIELGR
jgi:hypothetical protein